MDHWEVQNDKITDTNRTRRNHLPEDWNEEEAETKININRS